MLAWVGAGAGARRGRQRRPRRPARGPRSPRRLRACPRRSRSPPSPGRCLRPGSAAPGTAPVDWSPLTLTPCRADTPPPHGLGCSRCPCLCCSPSPLLARFGLLLRRRLAAVEREDAADARPRWSPPLRQRKARRDQRVSRIDPGHRRPARRGHRHHLPPRASARANPAAFEGTFELSVQGFPAERRRHRLGRRDGLRQVFSAASRTSTSPTASPTRPACSTPTPASRRCSTEAEQVDAGERCAAAPTTTRSSPPTPRSSPAPRSRTFCPAPPGDEFEATFTIDETASCAPPTSPASSSTAPTT